MKETDVGAAAVALLRARGFEVYQEVLCRTGDCVDIAATRGRFLVAVECKLAPTFEVMAQALRWVPHAHHVYVAAALPKYGLHRLARRLLEDLGLGFIGVRIPRYGGPPELAAEELLDPRLNRRADDALRRCLREEQKTYAPAGSNSGARWSPFKATTLELQRYVHRNPGCTMKSAVTHIDHHYGSTKGARSTLVHHIDHGIIPGIRVERRGRLVLLFPVDVTSAELRRALEAS